MPQPRPRAVDRRVGFLQPEVVRDVFVVEEAGAEQVVDDVAPVRRLGVGQADDAVVAAQFADEGAHARVAGDDEVALGAMQGVGADAQQPGDGGDIGRLVDEAEAEIAAHRLQFGALGRRQRVGIDDGMEEVTPHVRA